MREPCISKKKSQTLSFSILAWGLELKAKVSQIFKNPRYEAKVID